MDIAHLLVVDDEQNILKALQRLLSNDQVRLTCVSSGHEALAVLQQEPVDLVLSDMRMPAMSGAELMQQVAKLYPDTVRVILTGYADLASAMTAFNDGQIQRYLQKPWDNNELKSTIADLLQQQRLSRHNLYLQQQLTKASKALYQANQQLEQQVNQRTAQLKLAVQQLHQEHNAMFKVLYNVISIDSDLHGDQAQQVSDLCQALASRMGLEPKVVELISVGGLLAELGLLGVPAYLYQKPFYQLTPAERQHYYRHPQQAKLVLSPANHLDAVADMIAHQYERFNGGGIPDHLVADAIPLGSRVIAVARDFWAWRHGRYSEERHSDKKALQQIHQQQGLSYDPLIVQHLQQLVTQGITAANDHSLQRMSMTELKPGAVLLQPLLNAQHILILPKGHVLTEQSLLRLQHLAANSDVALEIYAQNPELAQNQQPRSMLKAALHSDS